MFIVNRNEIDPSVLNTTDEMIFEELKMYLESVGIQTYMIAVLGRTNSFMAKEIQSDIKLLKEKPTMLFFMKKHTKLPEKYNEQIKERWKELLAYHIYDEVEYHDDEMNLIEIDGEDYILEQYVRNFKIEIVDFMNSREIKPKNVYCSSEPAYNIVYDRKMEYEKASSEFEFITMCIKEHIKELVNEDFEISVDKLKVNFWNPFMPNYSGQGLARED
ncbi:MAG: hypothetical protein IKM20_01575 [Erysipelotrichales bacterium]|nr:hypothetical protein [Erysipelotrichales bacterium]